MALSTVLDLSANFNATGIVNVDLSGWDSAAIQLITPTATINFLTSNDSADVTGATAGNALTATNFTAMQATNLATGAAATSGATTGIWRTTAFGRYLQLSGTVNSITKLLVYLSKIS